MRFCCAEIILVEVELEYTRSLFVGESLSVSVDEKTALSKEDETVGEFFVLDGFIELVFVHK